MTPIELAADALSRNVEMVKSTLADFSDADLLVRPVPGANHTTWQLGHLILAEAWMVNGVAPGSVSIPEGYAEKFSKETSKVDDVAAFPGKADLIAAFEKTRAATVKWVKTLKVEDLNKPTPEGMQRFCPTIGHLLFMTGNHVAMHIGQFQVIRRRLGKPVLF